MGEQKFIQMVQVTWPRWPPCLYMVKTLKNSSPEPKVWWPWNLLCSIGCSSTTKLFKWWLWVDFDLFYGKVKFGPLCFCKTFFWNLQQMNEVARYFCWHQNFDPWGLSAPALARNTCINHEKNCIKSDFKEILLKLATNDRSDKLFLFTLKFCP